jgi:hypothetical protein
MCSSGERDLPIAEEMPAVLLIVSVWVLLNVAAVVVAVALARRRERGFEASVAGMLEEAERFANSAAPTYAAGDGHGLIRTTRVR